jgi:acrylyl-CoA reductase (NADPH)
VPDETFRALVASDAGGKTVTEFRPLSPGDLPEGDVLVEVAYSSLNYKDALAVTGRGKVIRRFPMVPGIDLAGTVVECSGGTFSPGDRVLVTGCGLGELHWGGFSEMARMKSEWLVPLPDGMSLRESMSIGTAGFTAMLAVMSLEEHGVSPGKGKVAVTGAAGGVGSLSVALLAGLGYTVAASTGRPEALEYLKSLGATEVVDRALLPSLDKPLESEAWAGGVDTVGGATLAGLLASTARHGCVAACGLAGGAELRTSVFPFILRGVTLTGIDSMACPMDRRLEGWERLNEELPKEALARIAQVRPLSEAAALSEDVLAGRVRGRIVLDVRA